MPGQSIRGQETIIIVVKDGEQEPGIDSITESEFTHNIDTQQIDILGEGSPRFDMIFNGTSFRLSGQLTNARLLALQQSIIAKASRSDGAAVRIDVSSTFVFPGETFTIAFEDCSFGSMPVTTGSRADFVTWTLEGSCSKGREIT